jgi:hypothetical protein
MMRDDASLAFSAIMLFLSFALLIFMYVKNKI